jgi:hypothetical protein
VTGTPPQKRGASNASSTAVLQIEDIYKKARNLTQEMAVEYFDDASYLAVLDSVDFLIKAIMNSLMIVGGIFTFQCQVEPNVGLPAFLFFFS